MIDGISGRPAGLNGSSGPASAAGKLAQSVVKPDATDVSETAPRAELSALATAARDAAAAPVDTARVAEIRAAIANGTYKIDPEKIAAKMIELDLGWTGKDGGAE